MFKALTHSAVFVTDQDEAVDFYVGKLGMEVVADVDLGQMRWLTVSVPGDSQRELLLERPEFNPGLEPEDVGRINELVSKGAMGLGFILTTDDCRKTIADLEAKDVEITQQPTERFYGVDAGIRDPFGNQIRITEPVEGPVEPPPPGEF